VTNSLPAETSTQGLKCKTNFDAPDAHFDYSSFFSDAQVEKVEKTNKPKKTPL
jgi:hypothetical protein